MGKIAIWAAFYPIIAHIGVQTSKIYLPIIYLVIIGLFLIYSSKIKSWTAKGFLTTVIIATALIITIIGKEHLVIQSIPVLILLALILIFSKSLVFKGIPIITVFASCVDEKPLNNKKKKYTRNVTIVWLIGFIYMFVQNIFTTIWLSIESWSWISSVGSYTVIALIMLGEFSYRNREFKHDKISFKTFIMRLSRCKFK
ncbi:hypothetical protein BHECKSOX_2056 [Bathymodiolus heckerae thiotrophic gill symbiont]|uniref:hypothetical protein n=1 Tax=Bathymodiolus heckerae thiotrophic gill symbiont TaxID=1052212 RepID=UPI0010B462C7|nr:hypothetical protein [Bathymodiolus heckerae thiotrophic gill symbiont]SHN91669.1 hypothetical protein BHECKSOX_2056 [Bathymodiolus heckerae thiotrophic gill symbiont]